MWQPAVVSPLWCPTGTGQRRNHGRTVRIIAVAWKLIATASVWADVRLAMAGIKKKQQLESAWSCASRSHKAIAHVHLFSVWYHTGRKHWFRSSKTGKLIGSVFGGPPVPVLAHKMWSITVPGKWFRPKTQQACCFFYDHFERHRHFQKVAGCGEGGRRIYRWALVLESTTRAV